jgi:hypothetical protein
VHDRPASQFTDKLLNEARCKNDIDAYCKYPFAEHMPKMFQLMMTKWRTTYKEDALAADFTAAWGQCRFSR